jgi:hypothetical protein
MKIKYSLQVKMKVQIPRESLMDALLSDAHFYYTYFWQAADLKTVGNIFF